MRASRCELSQLRCSTHHQTLLDGAVCPLHWCAVEQVDDGLMALSNIHDVRGLIRHAGRTTSAHVGATSRPISAIPDQWRAMPPKKNIRVQRSATSIPRPMMQAIGSNSDEQSGFLTPRSTKGRPTSALEVLALMTLTLIHPASNWTRWSTLRRHPCLSRAATSASSQLSPILCRSWLTVLLQFALGRPGPLLYPGTCQYSACCGIWTRFFTFTRPSMDNQQTDRQIYTDKNSTNLQVKMSITHIKP